MEESQNCEKTGQPQDLLKALRDSEERYRVVVEFSPDAIVVQSKGRYVYANPAALRLFGASRQEEVVGRSVLEFIHPDQREFIADRIRKTTENGLSDFRRESKILRLDGEAVHVEVAGTRFLYDGEPATQVFLRDISERKRAEEVRRESEAFLRRVLDSLYAFVGVLTPGGTLIQANLAALEAAGLKPEDVLGKPFDQTYWWDWSPEVQAQLRAAIKRAAAGESSRFDVVIRLGTERFVPIDFMLSPMRDDIGRITHLIPSAVPIEERKQMEEALREAKHDLEERVRQRTAELSQTLRAMEAEAARRIEAEHALRERSQQLRALASQLTLAEQRERLRMARFLHDDLQQLLVGAKFRLARLEHIPDKHVRQVADEVQELINHSLEAARSLTGELSPPILREGGLIPALEWLSRWMHEKHGLTVEMETDGRQIAASEDLTILLFQAVRELLFNVVKHAKTKTARVWVGQVDEQMEITVVDQGTGFDQAKLSCEGSTAGGFGLFSIGERLSLLGGRMEVDSAPGSGSRISLHVPVQQPGPVSTGEPRTVPGSSAPDRVRMSVLDKVLSLRKQKIRVLLVDDHRVMRQGLARLLSEEEDIDIVGEASDGEEAVSLARRIKPEVVLMDVSLPRMNGIQATEIIHAELPEIKIIGLSMFEELDRATAMREAGAVDYVSKSRPADAIIAAIRACTRPTQP